MKRFAIWLSLGILFSLAEVAAQQQAMPTSQETLVEYLKSDSIPTISNGIIGASRTPYQEWTAELRQAILYALKMELWRDAEAIRLGTHRFTDDNLVGSLAPLAVVTRDPAAIPSLALITGISSVRAALTEFGRQALPDMIRVVKEGEYYQVSNCLVALRQLVQVRGIGYFSDEERSELRALVALFLSPSTPKIRPDWHPTIRALNLVDAGHLALVLDDAQARRWVELLASDAEVFQAKSGTPHPEQFQKRLAAALNGAPLLPGPIPLSKHFESWREHGRHGMGVERQ